MSQGVPQASGALLPEPRMDVRHVADAVLFMASLPLDANIPFLTIMANGMPFMGRGELSRRGLRLSGYEIFRLQRARRAADAKFLGAVGESK